MRNGCWFHVHATLVVILVLAPVLASGWIAKTRVIESPRRRMRTCNDGIRCSTDQPWESVGGGRTGEAKRRRKKNKYAEFSKVNEDKDPLDDLLSESAELTRRLHEEANERRKSTQAKAAAIEELLQLTFPDSRDIDPYDPTTFGYIEVGTVIGAHGVHGLVKVSSSTDFPMERLCTAGIRHLKPAKKRAPRQIKLLEGRHRHEDEYLVRLDGVRDRDEAQRLRGSILYVRAEQQVAPEQEEYIISDLVGLDVFLRNDSRDSKDRTFAGTVGGIVFAEDIGFAPGMGHDMMEVVMPRGHGGTPSFRDELVLIPMVPEIVLDIDLENRAVYIDPPHGLLDLTYVREERTRTKAFLAPARDII